MLPLTGNIDPVAFANILKKWQVIFRCNSIRWNLFNDAKGIQVEPAMELMQMVICIMKRVSWSLA